MLVTCCANPMGVVQVRILAGPDGVTTERKPTGRGRNTNVPGVACMAASAHKDGFAFDHIESGVFLRGRVRKGGSPARVQVLEDGRSLLDLRFQRLGDAQS